MAYNDETGLYEGYIYKITNIVNEHIYIGQTRQTVEQRWKDHVKDCSIKKYHTCIWLYAAFRKYGKENFTICSLEKISSETEEELKVELNNREKYWIEYFKKILTERNMYNMTDGGDYDGCTTVPVPVIQYDLSCHEVARYNSIKEAKIATNICDISNVINRMDQHLTSGGYIWRKTSEPLAPEEIRFYRIKFGTMIIRIYSEQGELINEYDNIQSAIDEMSLKYPNVYFSKRGIIKCCESEHTLYAGFVWRYDNDPFSIPYNKNNYKHRTEMRSKYTGELIQTFNSASEAAKTIHLKDSQNISRACKRKNVITEGYYWCYEGDYDFETFKTCTNKPICQFDTQNNLLQIYDSIIEAAKVVGASHSDIGYACKGKFKKIKGFFWKYACDVSPDIINSFLYQGV